METRRGERVCGRGMRFFAVLAVLLTTAGTVDRSRAADPAPAPVRRAEAPTIADIAHTATIVAATGTPASPTPPTAVGREANVAASTAIPLPMPILPVRSAPPTRPAPASSPLLPPPPSTVAAPASAPVRAVALPTPTRVVGPQNHPPASRSASLATPTPNAAPSMRPAPAVVPGSGVAPITRPEVMRGIQYATWWHGEYAMPESDATLAQKVVPLGANWLSVLVTCYVQTITSTTIDCASDSTPTDDDLRHVIAQAKANGLKVSLKPHIDVRDANAWRGQIGEGMTATNRAAWFAAYRGVILRYAALAQETRADLFVVATELTTLSEYAAQWRSIVQAVRGTYTGPLTYAANWGEEWYVPWWDVMDYIGIDAYYPLTDHGSPTVAELKAAWGQHLPQIAQLSQQWGKPVLFTEAGYQSQRGTNITPWSATSGVLDLQEQANCYTALLETFRDQPWWRGVFWWEADVIRAQGGPENMHFTPINKPAAEVLRAYYGGIGAGPVGTPTPTPRPAPARR